MSVSRDIFRAWVRPGEVMREHLAHGRREERALAVLMAGCLLVFVSELPGLARAAELGGVPFDRAATYAFFSWLMLAPLLFYGIAFLSGLAARAWGARIAPHAARLALFWALLASSPALLLHGLMAGFAGQTTGTQLVGAVWLAAFLGIWFASLRAARTAEEPT